MQSMTVLEKVKEFLVRLVKDETFVIQLQNSAVEQAQNVLRDANYMFTKEEFEAATLQILELKEQDEFDELTEAELVGAIGGLLIQQPIFQPMYGVIVEPPHQYPPLQYPRPPYQWPWKPPIYPQPMYGVVVGPVEPPIAQPMYGVVISPDISLGTS